MTMLYCTARLPKLRTVNTIGIVTHFYVESFIKGKELRRHEEVNMQYPVVAKDKNRRYMIFNELFIYKSSDNGYVIIMYTETNAKCEYE